MLIAILIILLAFIFFMFFKGKFQKSRLTLLAGIAFGFVIVGLYISDEKRIVGYALLGIGFVLAIIDMIRKLNKEE